MGGTASLAVLFGIDEDNEKLKKFRFNSEWDEDEYIELLGDHAEVFTELLAIYRWQLFANLRTDGETISRTMIHRYEKHKSDLNALKSWVRTYAPDQYYDLFRKVKKGHNNYVLYSGHFKQKDLHGEVIGSCTQEEFYKTVKGLLKGKNLSDEAVEAAKPMLRAMEEENGFLPLLRIYLNGTIPNQLHA